MNAERGRRGFRVSALVGLMVASACGDNTGNESMMMGGETPVEFIDLRVEEITANRAVVRFDTSVPTSCEAEWGTAEDALDNTATDPDMEEGELAIEHEVPLEDLSPDQVYFMRARATDAAGNTYYSDIESFRTMSGDDMPDGTNVALMSAGSRVTDVSSNFGNAANDATWGASNAIDGSMSTEWSTNGDGDDAWVTIDFGQMRNIERFGFRSRKMADGTSIVTSVRIVLDGDAAMGPFSTPDPDERYVFDITPTLTRSVRVEAVTTTGGNTGAKEIQFFER